MIDEYIECLIADIKDTFKTIRKLGLRLFTIYIGGGTPTILSPKQLEKLLGIASECIELYVAGKHDEAVRLCNAKHDLENK